MRGGEGQGSGPSSRSLALAWLSHGVNSFAVPRGNQAAVDAGLRIRRFAVEPRDSIRHRRRLERLLWRHKNPASHFVGKMPASFANYLFDNNSTAT